MDLKKEIAENRREIIQLQLAFCLLASELGVSTERQKEILEDAEEGADLKIVEEFPGVVAYNKNNPKIFAILKQLIKVKKS